MREIILMVNTQQQVPNYMASLRKEILESLQISLKKDNSMLSRGQRHTEHVSNNQERNREQTKNHHYNTTQMPYIPTAPVVLSRKKICRNTRETERAGEHKQTGMEQALYTEQSKATGSST